MNTYAPFLHLLPSEELETVHFIPLQVMGAIRAVRWSRLSKQDLRFDRWSICQG
jgi:hypothetical protein